MIDPKIAVEAAEARDEYIRKHAQAEQERDAAIAERDRLRREVEALRDTLRLAEEDGIIRGAVADRLDAILRGES